MQGVSVLYAANGQPSFLTVDRSNILPAVRPLVEQLLEHIEQEGEATERAEWLAFSAANIEQAYGEDEPDYSDVLARDGQKPFD